MAKLRGEPGRDTGDPDERIMSDEGIERAVREGQDDEQGSAWMQSPAPQPPSPSPSPTDPVSPPGPAPVPQPRRTDPTAPPREGPQLDWPAAPRWGPGGRLP